MRLRMLPLALLAFSAACGSGQAPSRPPAPSPTLVTLPPTGSPTNGSVSPAAVESERDPEATPVRPPSGSPDAPSRSARHAVLGFDGVGLASFGQAPDSAVEAMRSVYGPPDTDSGWIDASSQFGVCPGTKVRGVEWVGLVLLFTDGQTSFGPAGRQHFFAYDYFSDDLDRVTLTTAKGIGVGSTVPQVRSAYPGATRFTDGPPYGAAVEISAGPRTIMGFLSSVEDDGVVESLSGGQVCGE